jgi:hypothetical protein
LRSSAYIWRLIIWLMGAWIGGTHETGPFWLLMLLPVAMLWLVGGIVVVTIPWCGAGSLVIERARPAAALIALFASRDCSSRLRMDR